MNIKKFFNRLFGQRKLSWSDKKHHSNYVFENFISDSDRQNVSKIFNLGSYRADGKYLAKIKKVIQLEKYNRICQLNKDYLWGEDELGEVPYGVRVQIYIIEFKDRLRLLAELLDDNISRKYEKSILYDKNSLPKNILQELMCKEQTYPYE